MHDTVSPLAVVRDDSLLRRPRPPVDARAVSWREFDDDEFWRTVPAWRDVSAPTFLDHRWQEKNAVTSARALVETVQSLPAAFIADLEDGMRRSPMSVRLSPYIVARIDWTDPGTDPLRRQFLPLGSQLEEDHPLVTLDSVAEQADSPVSGLTHRYFDRVLFLTTDRCPVYCRFCTRSYAIGLDTEGVTKVGYSADSTRWEEVFAYVANRVEVEDVVISGGDTFRLKPSQIRLIGNRLLDIPHVRRIRFATKGLAIQPMKILSDTEWTAAIAEVATRGRKLHKDVAIHTHFNHPREFTKITEDALNHLFERGIIVRNLTVILRGVNDDFSTQLELIRRLTRLNVRPYYTYIGDLVKGTEDLRTAVYEAEALEKQIRGAVAGHNTPTFVLDAPGGGGKRNIFSHEYYDEETGISVYAAPSVKPGKMFVYGDPLRYLSEDMQKRWREPHSRLEMLEAALAAAGHPRVSHQHKMSL